MDCARNIITANFSGGTSATTAPLWRWDYGQVLCITGIEDLPAAFEVHFSTNRTGGVSTTAVGADGQVTIPNVLLTIGKNLNAWIYLSDAQGEGETEYSIIIPVKARPMPEYYDAEATGEFDDVVRQVSEYAQTAQTAADNAGASATAAAGSASAAAASASSAAGSAGAAEQARADAVTAKGQAETAAQTATEKALQTAQNASQAALDAGRAESSAERAESAESGAEAAKTAAQTAANQSASYAGTASGKAALAEQSAEAAAVSATAAAQSAASIEGDVQTATAKAAEATAAAGQAVSAKDAAVTAQQGAETAATNAGQSASTATAKASEAATSASGAAQSKTDAEAAAARAEQAAASLTVDTALSDTSTNPVQNKIITAELTDVKSAISELGDMSPTTINCGTWVLGSFNTTTGAEIASTTRLRSDYIRVSNLLPNPIIFEVDTGYKYCVYLFDANKSLISAPADLRAWKTTRNTIVFPSNTVYMRVLVANTSDSTASTDYYTYVHISYQSDMVEAVDDMQLRLDSLGSIENVSLSDVTKWHIGSIEVATGKDYYAGTNRLCSDYIRVKGYNSITISVDSGYKWALYAYSDSYAFVSAKSVASFKNTKETVYISGFDYVRLLVANTSDGTASSAFSSHIHCTGIMAVAEKLIHSAFTSVDSVFGWEIGTLNTANGEEIDGTTRLRSGYLAVGTGTVIHLSDYSTYNHLIYLYDTTGAFVRSTAWQTTDIVITTDGYIRILIRYANNATITDADTVASACSINYCLPYNLIAKGIDVMTGIKAQANIMKQKKTSAEAWGECDLKLLYFTDVHGDVVRTENLASIAKAWGSNYFNSALCGGDIVKTLGTENLTWYYNALSGIGVPLLNTVGNHDAWSALNGTLLSKTDVYSSIIAPTVSNAGIVQPTDAATNGYNYYYKDFNSKVRLIVLDCMYWDATQLAWFESVLADAKANDMHVLCASHAAFPLANMTKVDCLWSKSGVNTDGVRTNIQAASAVKAFMDDGGIFVAWVVGHQHGDYVHILPDYGNQFVINLGSFAQRASFLLKVADPTAYNYNCMTYVCVDATNKILKLLRIGADIDIYGTKHDGLVIDYDTNTLISSWS